MADNDDKGSGGKPDNDGKPNNDDTEGLKKSLAAALAAQKEAENQVKVLRVEMAKVKSDDDASKSELEKLAERVKAAEEKQVEADARALRAEVAQAKKLSPVQAKRLQGTTREELETDADELVEAFGATSDDGGESKKTTTTTDTGRPKEKLRPGASPDGSDDTDYSKVADQVLGR